MRKIKASMDIIDKEFAGKVISKYASFSVNRSLVLFKKRISGFLDRIELVYALPLVVIKRNTLILEKIRTAVPIRRIWNILSIHFENDFSSSWYKFLSLRIPSVRVCISLDKFLSNKFFESQTLSLTKVIPEKQIGWFSERILLHSPRVVSSHLMKAIKYAEYGAPSPLTQGRIKSGKAGVTHLYTGTDVDTRLPPVTQDMYRTFEHTYPTTEHVVRGFPQIIKETKERIVEKEMTSKHQVQPPTIDVDRLANQIYQLLERKIRIERERRGL